MSQLAGNPTHEPIFSKTIQLQDGRSLKVADPTAVRALISLMDMQAVLGGAASHFGGPSAFAELMSAAWGLVFFEAQQKNRIWHELFNMTNDAGHCENGLYALKALYNHAGVTIEELKTFRSIESRLTGHGEVHVFPQGVYLSNGPLGSTLPQSEGLAMADHLARTDRVTVCAVSDGGLMEGEAREALASLPGLAASGKLNSFVMIISDNNTKLTGRIDKDAFSMEPTFQSLRDLGWDVLELADGHNLQLCAQTLQEAFTHARANPARPVAIHAKTKKGYGVKSCVESASGGHGFPVKDPKDLRAFISEIYQGAAIPEKFLPWLEELEAEGVRRAQKPKAASSIKKEKIQVGVAQALLQLKSKGLQIVSVTADLPGSTGVLEFQKKYPESTFDVGVAEANMISVAAGFSKQGFIPVVDTFAQFGVTKGALPITMAALSEAPVIAIFSHTGFQDAADGASHQALSYLAQAGSIPHTEVYGLTCRFEAEALVAQAVERFARDQKSGNIPPNFIFFLGREDFPQELVENGEYRLGKAQVLYDSTAHHKDAVAIVAAGSLAGEGLAAATELDKLGIGAIAINPSCLNRVDADTIGQAVKKCGGRLITLEDHQVLGGLSSFLLPALLESSTTIQKFKALGVRDQFGRSAYKASELYKLHNLTAAGIVDVCRKWL